MYHQKSKSIMRLLWFCGFGMFGLHRFYIGDTTMGLVYMMTGGLCLVGAIGDFFKLGTMIDNYNLKQDVRATVSSNR